MIIKLRDWASSLPALPSVALFIMNLLNNRNKMFYKNIMHQGQTFWQCCSLIINDNVIKEILSSYTDRKALNKDKEAHHKHDKKDV